MEKVCGSYHTMLQLLLLIITHNQLLIPTSSFLIPTYNINRIRINEVNCVLHHGTSKRLHRTSSIMQSLNNDADDDEDIPISDWDESVPGLNTVTLAGRIGNEPEPRYLENGSCVLNLSLAVRRKYHPLERTALKITEEETDWFALEIWGRDAEYASKFITKGARVGITGGLTIDEWTDKNTNERRSRAKIIVKHLDILETKAEADMRLNRPQSTYNNNNASWKQQQSQNSDNNDMDDTMSAGTGGFFDN